MPLDGGDGNPVAIMLLGPRTFLDRLRDERPSTFRGKADLLPLREDLARMLSDMGAGGVVVMEAEKGREGEKNVEKFLRLLRDRRVGAFFVLWPCRAQMKGVDVELGYVLAALAKGELSPDDVHLFVEDGVVRVDKDGVIVGHSEDGNRTWYYEDLLAFGCPYYTWKSLHGLYLNVSMAADEWWGNHRRAQASDPRVGGRRSKR